MGKYIRVSRGLFLLSHSMMIKAITRERGSGQHVQGTPDTEPETPIEVPVEVGADKRGA